jgi:hypothetical protein
VRTYASALLILLAIIGTGAIASASDWLESLVEPGVFEGDACEWNGFMAGGHGASVRPVSITVTSSSAANEPKKAKFWASDESDKKGRPIHRRVRTRRANDGSYELSGWFPWDENLYCRNGSVEISFWIGSIDILVTAKRCRDQVVVLKPDEDEIIVTLECDSSN